MTQALGRPLRLRVQLSSFDAVCRMVAAGVGVGVVPASSAQRSLGTLQMAQVELADAWRVRERYVLMREGDTVPTYAQALVDALLAFGARARKAQGQPRP